MRKQLEQSAKDLKHLAITDIMPSQIAAWHHEFVSDFNWNGGSSTSILNRSVLNFIKQKNGYIMPVMIHVKFHYSHDYSYTFVCFASFLTEI